LVGGIIAFHKREKSPGSRLPGDRGWLI
jgi:hypothetical protein